jgi:uncharacterized protein YacL
MNEKLTGSYNYLTDKIEGCTENSLVWFHEQVHQEQFKDNNIHSLQIWFDNVRIINQIFSFIGLVLGLFISYLFCICYLPLTILSLEFCFKSYIETEAHIKGKKRYKEYLKSKSL